MYFIKKNANNVIRRRVGHLAELFPVGVWQECFEGLKSSVDALHPAALVAVGDFTANSPLLVLGRLWTQGNVCQAGND